MKKFIVLLLVYFCSIPCFSWSGFDYDKGNYIDIGKGNLVRRGREIELFDYQDAEYKTYEVENIRTRASGRHTELDLYDWQTGEYRTVEMDNY